MLVTAGSLDNLALLARGDADIAHLRAVRTDPQYSVTGSHHHRASQ
ncbi:hypothetical protein NSERUTF1_4254 [Nocardia seriolae]|nr:hypothetical protein NSERUTF1_4254 [Nocardia seriolae]